MALVAILEKSPRNVKSIAMSTAIKIAILQKKIIMEQEKATHDPIKGGITIDNINRYRSYKGQSNTKSEYQQRGEKFGVYVCKAGRNGIYNT